MVKYSFQNSKLQVVKCGKLQTAEYGKIISSPEWFLNVLKHQFIS